MDLPPAPPPPDDAEVLPVVRCKPKHRALTGGSPGTVRGRVDVRSRCPGWVTAELQDRLLQDALADPDSGPDAFGRPRKLWNAVAGWVFIGVSSNERAPAYNCYPEAPMTSLAEELRVRERRTVEQFLGGADP